ncbi:helix-turn-helix transcriptional regulator [Thiohalobacter thiocyanaticus]|nr:helix-turn-helix transcriptional regulator [Thiohalobacter thiocyanaticus]
MAGTWAKQRIILRKLMREMHCRHDLTQAELAKYLYRPQSYVSKIESGERNLDFVDVYEICRCCGEGFEDFAARFVQAIKQK